MVISGNVTVQDKAIEYPLISLVIVDAEKKEIQTSIGTLGYDILVLALLYLHQLGMELPDVRSVAQAHNTLRFATLIN